MGCFEPRAFLTSQYLVDGGHKPFISRTHGQCLLLTAETTFDSPVPRKEMQKPGLETGVPSWVTWIFESHGARNRSIFCELGPASTTTRAHPAPRFYLPSYVAVASCRG